MAYDYDQDFYYNPNAPGPQFDPETQGIPVDSPYWGSSGGFSYDWATPWGTTQAKQPSAPSASSGGRYYSLGKAPEVQTLTSTTTPVKPSVPMPTFELPEWDESAIKSARRKYMAPARRLREGLRRTLSSIPSARNPYVAREMGRGAVEAFGTGLSDISYRAGILGQQEYAQRRAEEIAALQANFQAAMQDYMAQYGQKKTVTAKTTYGEEE